MKTNRAHLGFALVLAALVAVTAEGLAYGAITVLNRWGGQDIRRTADIYAGQSERIRELLSSADAMRELHDGTLGWRYRPGFKSGDDHISAQGLRGTRTYTPQPDSGVLRIAAFGDSFVYGNEVGTSDAWPAKLEAIDPHLEVLNFGVGGYGTDQALLRYRTDGRAYAPHVVLIGFAPIDMRRNVNVYRRFLSSREGIAVKPRFRQVDGELVLVPNPVPAAEDWRPYLEDPRRVREFGRYDQWYRPLVYENPIYDWIALVRLGSALAGRIAERYLDPNRLLVDGVFNPESEAFALQLAIFATFVREVRHDGARPYVLILPDRASVEHARAGRPTVSTPLITAFGRDSVLLDAADAFAAADGVIGDWFMPGGHYSAAGNRVVAQWLHERVAGRDGSESVLDARTSGG